MFIMYHQTLMSIAWKNQQLANTLRDYCEFYRQTKIIESNRDQKVYYVF